MHHAYLTHLRSENGGERRRVTVRERTQTHGWSSRTAARLLTAAQPFGSPIHYECDIPFTGAVLPYRRGVTLGGYNVVVSAELYRFSYVSKKKGQEAEDGPLSFFQLQIRFWPQYLSKEGFV